MRKLFAILILSFGILAPRTAFAGGYTGPGKILKFSTISSNGSFELIGNFTDPDNCGGGNLPEKYIVGAHATDTDLSRQSKFSVVLSAYHSGKTIELYVDGCMGILPIVKFIYTPAR